MTGLRRRPGRMLLLVVGLSFALTGFSASPPAPESLVVEHGSGALDGDFADPFVLRARGHYYAFATGARGSHLQVAKSRDLKSWTVARDPLPALPAWADKAAGFTWAPAVLPRGASYVLYYTTRERASGFQCISRAVAERPGGPYVDRSEQ